MALMISVSGIRGIFGTDLTPENLIRFTAAFGIWLKGGTVVVGRDTRVTGKICEDLVVSTLQSVGCNVIKTGIVPTPTVAMSVLRHKAAGGIVISASHNPPEWNALKLLNEKSEFLDAEQGMEIIEISKRDTINYQPFDKLGKVTEDDQALSHHIEKILELPYIDADTIASAGFAIALDPVNGTGSTAIPALLNQLGIDDIHEINAEPNGLFAHNPEPLPEHLTDLSKLVREKNCDIGIVTDPDSDRLALITNEGKPFGEEYTQAAAFDFILSKTPGPCATNLSSSRVVDDIAKKFNQPCYRSAVGEINVVKKMQEVSAVVGGEGNGGVINPDLHYGRDALAGTAMILQMLAERNITASEYRNSLPDYFMRKDKVILDGIDADAILKSVKQAFANQDINTVDGVKINFKEGWVHLRKSNTEPIIRIYSEGTSPDAAAGLAAQVTDSFQ